MAELSLARDMIRSANIIEFAKELGIDPDEKQRYLLTSTSREILMCCTRQWGKSSCVSLIALHEALYKAPAMIILISPSLKQSSELFRKVHGYYLKLAGAPKLKQESLTQMELVNGSRIISLPASEETVRGYSAVTLLIVDESGNVPEELLTACEPMLATTDGRFVALGTPKGKVGWWHSAWTDGEGYERISAKASECSRIKPAYLARQLKKMGPMIYSQEFECAFIDSNTSAFSSMLIEKAFRNDFAPFT
jgi:Terminase large subunit, T4likevirus-type, N-terminal